MQPLHLIGGADPALTTVSGTGQMAPKSIMVIPLVFNQQLTGVMEFAFLSGGEASDLEFLKQAAEPVAALMLSMEARWQIDQLYREASQANRALEEKSNELEELNQELSPAQRGAGRAVGRTGVPDQGPEPPGGPALAPEKGAGGETATGRGGPTASSRSSCPI